MELVQEEGDDESMTVSVQIEGKDDGRLLTGTKGDLEGGEEDE
jgi:hypothetical protein